MRKKICSKVSECIKISRIYSKRLVIEARLDVRKIVDSQFSAPVSHMISIIDKSPNYLANTK